MRELSEETMDLIDGVLMFGLHEANDCDDIESANRYRAALAEFRAWRAEREKAAECWSDACVCDSISPASRPCAPCESVIASVEREAREKATEPNPFAAAFGAFPDFPLPEEEAPEPGCETCGGEGLTHRAGTRRIDRETCPDCKGTGKREGGEHG